MNVQGSQLSRTVNYNGIIDQSAAKVGDQLTKAEKNAFRAFSLTDAASDEKARLNLAHELGMNCTTAPSAYGLQLAAQQLADKARRLFELITNLLAAKKKTLEAVISNIGR